MINSNLFDRLTIRARSVLTEFGDVNSARSADVVASIVDKGGLGSYLVLTVTKSQNKSNNVVELNKLVKEAFFQAAKLEHVYVGTEHILLAFYKLTNSKIYDKARTELIKLNTFPNSVKAIDKIREKTPVLNSFSSNLNQKVLRNYDKPLVMRDEYDSMVAALLLKDSFGVLLTGENGVGKKTMVELLSHNIVALDIPAGLAGAQVIDFDIMNFMTGLVNRGANIELVLAQLSDELKSMARPILFIRNFQSLFYSTSSGIAVPVFYAMFRSAIEPLGIKIIGTMSNSVYDKLFSENDHIVEGLTVVEISSPDEKTTLNIMQSASESLGAFHNIEIPKNVVKEVYKKAKTIDTSVKFPKKGVELLDHCCTYVLLTKSRVPKSYKEMIDKSFDMINKMELTMEGADYDKASRIRQSINTFDKKLSVFESKIFKHSKRYILTVKDVEDAFVSYREERVLSDDPSELTRLASVGDKIKKRIIGQDEAVSVVSKSLIRSSLGLRSKKRPQGNFLFLGPTGVGKTELAKVLADIYFGDNSLIRLDMSDFSEKHTVARLVGAPPGYVGFGEGGELTTKIASKPDSVVLFDEIEKAHTDVLNILLQIMDEGELRDARGNTFDFSRSVVILTSNLGTEILHQNGIGFEERIDSDEKVEERLKSNLKKIIKPELLNRFDEIVIFKQLKKESQIRILDLLIKDIQASLTAKDVTLKVSGTVKKLLLEKGYSKEYGARALRRTLEKELLDKIAEVLLESKKGSLMLRASVVKDEIIVTKD
jgi:ATP-dependent Clp protease ATP-binding subunit ClpC